MKAFHALLLTGAAALVLSATPVDAGEKVTKNKDGSYKVVTYEGNKKITTVYKPIGVRKVGLVGSEPYPVRSGKGLTDGGEYYTENGVKYFRPTKTLDVEYTGRLNSND